MPPASKALLSPEAGEYITDGQRLYCVIGVSETGLYEIEDASSGRVVSLMPRSVTQKKWRVVVPEEVSSDGA